MLNQRDPLPRDRWAQLVSQLSDSRYSRREAADRQLRAEGKSVLSYLEALRADELDFEQQHRIRGIRRWLTRGDDNDAPESIAAWLGADPRVWLALLNHTDLDAGRSPRSSFRCCWVKRSRSTPPPPWRREPRRSKPYGRARSPSSLTRLWLLPDGTSGG